MGLGALVEIVHAVVGLPGLLGGVGAGDDEVRLDFPGDVPNYIIFEVVGVLGALVGRGRVDAVGRDELVEVVVGVVLLGGAAELAALGHGGGVVGGHDVAHEVVVVAEVLDDPSLGGLDGEELGKSPGLLVVGVGGDDVVAVGDGRSLAVFVIDEVFDVGILVLALHAFGFFEEPAAVIGVVELFAVGIGHLEHPAEGVEDVLGLVALARNGVVAGVDLAEFFGDLAEPSVPALFGAGFVYDLFEPAGEVSVCLPCFSNRAVKLKAS